MEIREKVLLRALGMAFLLSIILTVTTLFISSKDYFEHLFSSYFKSPGILLFNFLPIFFSMVILLFLFNSLKISFIINSIVFNLLAYTNYIKIIYRQEPLKFSDYKFIREAFIMSKKYSLKFDGRTLMVIAIAFFIIFIMVKFMHKYYFVVELRVLALIVTTTIFFVYTIGCASDYNIYKQLGAKSGLNTWQELNGYQARGFTYPLLYTLQDINGYVYKDYDKNNALQIAKKYRDENIPENEKINIVVVMLESYKDFYKFQSDKLKFNVNPYEYFYKLQEESISGDLVVDSFGGGTIISESCFWSGYRVSPNYDVSRNTHVNYLRSQGYNTDSLHPSDGLFNNRKNFYPNVGFNNFYNTQNYFKDFCMPNSIITDDVFFPELLEIYKDNADTNKPYFSFSITYQNHGPYPTEYIESEREYIKFLEEYDLGQYMAFNNYLHGVYETTNALPILVEGFREREEPVVLVLFGDHSPSMGDGEIGMKMMGIESDIGTTEGMLNTYETPYLIWANESCRTLFNKDFLGKGPTMDTNLLMTYLFDYIGWKGNAYNAFLQDFYKNVTVTKKGFFREHGEYVNELSPENAKVLKDLKDFEYYYSRLKVDN